MAHGSKLGQKVNDDMPTQTATIQHLRTTHDANGNPRRVWHVTKVDPAEGRHGIKYTRTVAFYDEGYTGSAFKTALAKALEDTDVTLLELPMFNVPPDEYKLALGGVEEVSGPAEKAAKHVADTLENEGGHA